MACFCCKTKRRINVSDADRSCTDVLCLVLFVIFFAGLVLIPIVCIIDGSLKRIYYGYDSFGNICDSVNKVKESQNSIPPTYSNYDTTDLKYVYYFNFKNAINTTKVCVKKCPDREIDSEKEFLNFTKTEGKLCLYDVEAHEYNSNKCPDIPAPETFPYFHRCIPNFGKLIKNSEKSLLDYVNDEWFQLAVSLIIEQLKMALTLAFIPVLISFCVIAFLGFVSKKIIFALLIMTCLALFALNGFLWYKYKTTESVVRKIPILNYEINYKTSYLIYASVISALTVVFVILVIAMRKRIVFVVKLFGEAQKALRDLHFGLLVIPFTTFAILLFVCFMFLSTSLLIAAFGKFGYLELAKIHSNMSTIRTILFVYHAIGFIWITQFIFACESMVVSGSVAKWYFSSNKSDLYYPILSSIRRLIKYHLGSVLLGSFIVTALKAPRYLIWLLRKKTQSKNKCLDKLCKCVACCLWCLEKCMKFVNYNAYVIVNLESVGYCSAARRCLTLIATNGSYVVAINSIGDFILFVAKLLVTIVTLIIAIIVTWQIPTTLDELSALLQHQSFTLLITGIIAYLIADCFLSINEMVIDAIMMCFFQDTNLNDGTPEKPYFMSTSLRECVNNYRRTIKSDLVDGNLKDMYPSTKKNHQDSVY